jgi:hypothetical protein
MLTAHETDEIPVPERIAFVEAGARQFLGERYTQAQLMAALGYSRQVWNQWTHAPARIPAPVMMIASHWQGLEPPKPAEPEPQPIDPEIRALATALRESVPVAQLAVNGLADLTAALDRLLSPEPSDAAPADPASGPDTEA